MAPLYNYVSGKAFISGPVRTTLEKFESGVFTLRTHQMFSAQTTPKKFENSRWSFWICAWRKLSQESQIFIVMLSFSKELRLEIVSYPH